MSRVVGRLRRSGRRGYPAPHGRLTISASTKDWGGSPARSRVTAECLETILPGALRGSRCYPVTCTTVAVSRDADRARDSCICGHTSLNQTPRRCARSVLAPGCGVVLVRRNPACGAHFL